MKHKHLKKKAYGSKRTKEWCRLCDADLIIPQPSKKRERNRTKKIAELLKISRKAIRELNSLKLIRKRIAASQKELDEILKWDYTK